MAPVLSGGVITTLGALMYAASLLLSWLNSATHVLHAEKRVYDRWAWLLATRWTNRRFPALLLLTLLFVAATVAFLVGWHPLLAGGLLFALMAGIRQWEIRQWNYDIVVGLGKYVPTAASLMGFLLTVGIGQWVWPWEVAVARGWDAACGIIAGCWGLAAFAKLRESGKIWASADNVAILVWERTYHGPAVLNRLRRAAANLRPVCWAASMVGMWGEALGLLFIFPAARWPVAIGLGLFQVGIYILLGYRELEWILVMLACAALSHSSVGLLG